MQEIDEVDEYMYLRIRKENEHVFRKGVLYITIQSVEEYVGGTICRIIVTGSVCSPEDNFCAKAGVAIAKQRQDSKDARRVRLTGWVEDIADVLRAYGIRTVLKELKLWDAIKARGFCQERAERTFSNVLDYLEKRMKEYIV